MSSLCKFQVPAANFTLSGFLRFSRLHRLLGSVPLSVALTASLALASAAWSVPEVEAQSIGNNFGSVNVCPSGSSSPAPCTGDLLVQIVYGSVHGTPTAPQALTAGAPSSDFSIIGNDCTESVPPAVGCLVHVIFSPQLAGLRAGAIVIPDTAGGILATTLIYGVGVGPQIAFGPGVQSAVLLTPGSVESEPYGLAVDGAGNVFFSDRFNHRVVKVPAGGGAQSTVIGGLGGPYGLALDGAGNLFVAEVNNNDVLEVSAGGGTVTPLGSGLSAPQGVAVDGAGDVFIADTNNQRVVELPAGGGAQTTVATGVTPLAVAVDGAGDLFIGESDRVVELIGGKLTTLVTGLSTVNGLAVDAAGDLFIADYGNSRVVELPAGGTEVTTVVSGVDKPIPVAVDEVGDLFIGESNMAVLLEVQRSQPPALSFASTAVGNTSSDSPKSVQVQSIGNQTLTGSGLTVSTNFDLVAGSGTPEDCTAAFSLTPGAECNISISFEPTAVGDLTGTVTLTDNSLNNSAATQSIELSGTGTASVPPITWATPAPITYGTALSATQLDATSTVAGTFAYTPAAGTVLGAGQQTLTTTFTPTDTTKYTTAQTSVTLTVNQATPTITWATPAPITYGTALSATQLDASSTVAGTFTYTPAAGTTPGAGSQTLKVTLTPTDATDYATAQASVALTVNQATPTITWATPAPIPYGTPLSATQLDATSTVAGTFAYTPAAGTVLGVGPQTLKVTLTPTNTTDYTTATASVPLTVTQAPQTISFTGLPATATFGAAGPYTLAATASSGLPVAYTVSGPGSISGTTLTVNGAGTVAVTASQPGNADYAAATPVTLSISVAAAISATSLSSSALSSTFGGSVTLTAIVTSAVGTPSGMVTFASGTTPLGTGMLNSSGVAFLTTTALPVGDNSISASYSASGNYQGSSSPSLSVVVSAAASSISLTSSATTAIVGSNVTLTATVTSPAGVPAGTVTFSNGSAVLGTGTLNASGVASLTTNTLPLGSNALIASFSGGGNFASSTSYPVALLVSQIPTTTMLVSSSASAVAGATVTFTATVVVPTGSVGPTGLVSFSDGGTVLGSPSVDGNGVATYSTSSLAAGSHAILASYAGDATHTTSTSTVLLQTITSPSGGGSGFTMSASNNALSIVQGQTGTTVLTLTSSNSSSSAVTLTCSGLPRNSNCTFSPASVTPTSDGATSTLLISTDVKSTSTSSTSLKTDLPGGPASPRTLTALAGIGLGGFVLLLGMADRRRFRRLLGLRGVVLALGLGGALVSASLGCGGGGTPKTATGLYQVSVIGTGTSNGMTVSQTIPLYVTITK